MLNPYIPTGNPQQQSREVSAPIRAEFQLIAQAFSSLLSGYGVNAGIDVGTADNYQVVLNANVTALTQFMLITVLISASNATTTPTLTVSGVGTATITRHDQSPLQPNDIQGGGIYEFYFDGTNFQLQANPLCGTATGQVKFIRGTAVASAATLNLDAVVGNYAHVTGTASITAITLTTGIFMCVFDGAATLTNGANLLLPGGANITAQPGDIAIFWGDASGVVRCAPYVPISPASAVVVPNGYINGFTLSNDGTTPNTVLDIALGQCKDSTNTSTIALTAFTKSISATWASGSGNGGMGQGLTAAINTWYHVYAATISGAPDVFFDTSITAANKPSGTTAFRYIGSFKTDASAHILRFTQVGQMFYWNTLPNDLTTGSAPGGKNLLTISTPPGIVTFPIVYGSFGSVGSSQQTDSISSGLTGLVAASVTFVGNVFGGEVQAVTATNTSSQIYYTAGAGDGITINTIGYQNPKVAPNN